MSTEDAKVSKTFETSPNNLPLQVNRFIGREREMTAVRELLATTRLLTLTGPGGSGKTRLALQVATDLLSEFEHGVWWAVPVVARERRKPLTNRSGAGRMNMNALFRRLTCFLMMTGMIVPFLVLSTPGLAHAAATCTPKATLPADIPPSGPLDTGANVIATFNNARQQEGCNVSLSIDPTAYDAATPQMQELMLVNAERQDRGLGTLQLDAQLLSQIDLNHSSEMVKYNYFAHSSPINQPGGKNDPITRITVNPAVTGHNTLCCAENIAGGGPAGDAIYRFMYEDSASTWGHRQNILGYCCQPNPTFGHYTWIGIGIAMGGTFSFYSTLDFLEDSTSTKYTPPTTADTQPPTMNPPTIVDANTVQVTNVQDDSDGTQAAAVTGVVFYVGSAVDPSGKFLTVVAKQDPATPGTWTANLSATDPTTLHAVAVDGSGNFNDCTGDAPSC